MVTTWAGKKTFLLESNNMALAMEKNPTHQMVFFDPDKHPDATLKAFEEYIIDFGLLYDATYPEPPKSSMEMAILRWKASQDNKTAEPDLKVLDDLRDNLREKD